jgi:hypothetical protein
MKILAKTTHYDIEIDPADIPDDAILNQLLESIRHGWPVNHDVVEAVVRNVRAPKVVKKRSG